MLKSTNTLLKVIFFFLFWGCSYDESLANKEKNETEPINIDVTKQDTPKKESSFLEDLGLSFEEEKIIIDMNKTSHFFETFEQRMEEKIHDIEINATRDAGVVIEKDEIKVDLNQTKKVLDNLSHFFEALMPESNDSSY